MQERPYSPTVTVVQARGMKTPEMTKPAKASTPKKARVPIKSRLGIRPIETTKCPSQMRLSKRENPISKKSLKVDGKRYVKKVDINPSSNSNSFNKPNYARRSSTNKW